MATDDVSADEGLETETQVREAFEWGSGDEEVAQVSGEGIITAQVSEFTLGSYNKHSRGC